jgi:phosphoenolpyruvate carboxykinase (ATP)
MGKETSNGTLAVNTGKFTGRSSKDRYLVKDDYTKDRVWWRKVNKPFDADTFDVLQGEIVNYLSNKEIYIRDGYLCADPKYRTNVRTVAEYPWSSTFVYNMFLRLEGLELKSFKEDWLVLCAPGFEATPEIHGTRQGDFSIINFTKKIALIGGSAYIGEIKKGVFSALNMILPTDRTILPMHCSTNT